MPQIIPVVIGAATAILQGGSLVTILGKIGLGIVGTVLSSAFNKKPKKSDPFARQAVDRIQTIRSSIEPHRVIYGRAKVSGPLVYATSTGTGSGLIHLVIPLAGHEVSSIESVFLDDDEITPEMIEPGGRVHFGKYTGWAKIQKFTGAPGQVAAADLVAEAPSGEWTAAHVGTGIAYLYVRLEYNDKTFPSGLPNISAIVKGKKVYDPRTGTSAWSENAALCILDYLRADYGLAIDDTEWDAAWWTAQANLCDELVAIDQVDGEQKRYTLNGTFQLSSLPIDIVEGLLTSCAGTIVYQQGQYKLHAAAYMAPTVTLTGSDLRGDVEVVARPARRDLFNAVRGTFVDPGKGWVPTDFPPVTNPLYEAQDDGERIYRDLELPYTADPVAAQRIGKIVLEKHRQGISIRFPAKLTALRLSAWDVVAVTLAEFGWTAKPFRVTSWTLADDGGIDLTLQEEAASSYAWDFGEASTYDTAPDTSFRSPFQLPPAPTVVSVAESLYVTRSGDGVKTMARLSWIAAADAFVVRYRIEYLPSTETAWRVAGEITGTRFDIEDITPGAYQFRVYSINVLGLVSEPATSQATISGLLSAPATLTGLGIQAVSSLAVLRWDQSTDLDVRIGGSIEIRHSPLTAGATWENSTSISEALPGSATMAVVPLKSGTYLLKAIDSSGLRSTTAATITSEGATAVAFTTLSTLTEDTTFPGTKTGCTVASSVLKLSGAGLFDDITDLSTVTDLDNFGGQSLVGTYEFATTIDLTASKRVQVSSHVKAALVNVNDTVDNRQASIDNWTDFDGSIGANGDVIVFVRTSPDNVTYSDWQRLDVAEFQTRYLKFKAELSVADAIFNVEVSELRAYAKEVA